MHEAIADLATQGLGPTAIARQLGVPVTRILTTYRRLQREGRIPRRRPSRKPTWSSKETDKLVSLIEQGYDYDTIARRLKRTRIAVVIKAKRLGTRITTTNATLSARDIAEMLGIRCAKTVSKWIQRGWLQARNAGRSDRPLWRITWEDLTAFLEVAEYWIAWDPARIADLALREWAQDLRQNSEQYLTQTEIAARYHVDRGTVAQWIDKGWLPALRYGNRRVPASALEGFIPPCWGGAPEPICMPTRRQIVGRVGGVTFLRYGKD
jgi:excisionase family DNA binding protein